MLNLFNTIIWRYLLITSSILTNIIFSQSDNCSNAINLTPNLSTCSFRGGSSANATQSIVGCSGNADDDVWYYFIANSNEMEIKVDPTAGYDAVFELFNGNCSSSSLGCVDSHSSGINEEYSYTGLTIGQTYYLRIYHEGVGYGSGNFRVCVSGIPQPINNSPCNSFFLPKVTPACKFLTFKTINHSGSGINNPGCGRYLGGDYWFKVVVPNSGKLEVFTQSVDINDGAMAMYKKNNNCNNLTLELCNDDGGYDRMPYLFSTGNIPGDTMYIRFWDYGNTNFGKFKICVSTPDNDSCHNALEICDLNGYSSTTSSKYPIDQPGNMASSTVTPPGPFGDRSNDPSISIDNNSWLTFIASDTSVSLTIEIEDCWEDDGIQVQVFSGVECDSFRAVSNFIQSSTSQILTASGLIVGNKYYIVVDGFNGDVCSYTITANSGVKTIKVSASDSTICNGESVTLNSHVFGSGNYNYTWQSIPASQTYPNSPSISVNPTVTTEYFVTVTGLCGEASMASIIINVDTMPDSLNLTLSQNNICYNGTSTISNIGSTNNNQYLIYNSPTSSSSLGSLPYVYNPNGYVGNKTFYVGYNNLNGCFISERKSITVSSLDTIITSISCPQDLNREINSNCEYVVEDFRNTINLNNNCYSDNINIIQSPMPGTILNVSNSNITFTQEINLTVDNGNGNFLECDFNVNISCIKSLIIPQFISPNGDNSNDVFFIKNLGSYKNNNLIIFNRWGNKVFEQNNYNNSWKGKNQKNNAALPSGTYFYILTLNNKEKKFNGYLQIRK